MDLDDKIQDNFGVKCVNAIKKNNEEMFFS
jgi:hypothetical protein